MRVILVNPFDQTIKEAVYGGDFREIYDLIECSTFDVVYMGSGHDMYVDDEGLLKSNQRFFRFEDRNLAGKALIMKNDSEGESIDADMSLEDVVEAIEWLPEGHREEPYMEFKVLS